MVDGVYNQVSSEFVKKPKAMCKKRTSEGVTQKRL